MRGILQGAFPGPGNQVSDETVDAVVRSIWRDAQTGIEQLGLPAAPEGLTPAPAAAPGDTASYQLYLATATHQRVRQRDSDQPFASAFVGHLPTVRVPLPRALSTFNTVVSTVIGDVDFASDHLAGSVNLLSSLYADRLGYSPARVDLITPARLDLARFAAIAIYLGYSNEADPSPSFYVLEAGLVTGQAAMLYLGETMDTTLVTPCGYMPTPFSSDPEAARGRCVDAGGHELSRLLDARFDLRSRLPPKMEHAFKAGAPKARRARPARLWPGT